MKIKNFIALSLGLIFSQQANSTTDNSSVNALEQPNIIMIISDDFGKQDLSLYGSSLYETPNIDSLAKQGVRFDNAYVSHPRCVPSRISIMSGQDSARMGSELIKKKHQLPVEKVTFAEHLQQAGYKTGYIGKWHLGKSKEGWPENQGFDENMIAGSAGSPDSYFYPWGAKSKKGKNTFGHLKGTEGEFITERLTQEAEGFIERHKDSPFLLVLAHYAVHTPIEAEPETVKYYEQKLDKMGLPAAHKKNMPDLLKDKDWGTEYKSQQNNPTYAAMVDSVDVSVGRVLDTLEKLDLGDNTIVMFTSDHGGLSARGANSRELATSNLPYRNGKGWLYDGGIRVPLIVKWPEKIKPGSINASQVTGTDHYPTILQMANLPLSPKDHIDGASYFNALEGETLKREPFFYHSPLGRPNSTGDTNASAVIDGPWKLIHWFDDNRIELFNIEQDKGETTNVASKYPSKVKELKGELSAWLTDVNAQYRKPKSKSKWDKKSKVNKKEFNW